MVRRILIDQYVHINWFGCDFWSGPLRLLQYICTITRTSRGRTDDLSHINREFFRRTWEHQYCINTNSYYRKPPILMLIMFFSVLFSFNNYKMKRVIYLFYLVDMLWTMYITIYLCKCFMIGIQRPMEMRNKKQLDCYSIEWIFTTTITTQKKNMGNYQTFND